ncbi:enoyl-CoA hydratase/isomerase family protein [Jatrophihabitans sp. DSM 45814]
MTADVKSWDDAGLQYEVEDGVAWLRLNHPDKRNAIDRPMRIALLAAIHEVTEDPAVRAAVITGNGKAFSSGADLTQEGGPLEVPPERRRSEGPNVSRDDGLMYGWARLLERIWRSEKTFIAGVNGMAAGGGCQLALGCDLIIASEEASFWEVFVQRGLPLEGGGAWILPKLTSLVRAKEMALLGKPLPAIQAEKWGMVNRVVPHAEFDATLREWAKEVASGPTVRMGHIKGQLNSSFEAGMLASFKEEATLLGIGGGADGHEAMQAYVERRAPQFRGI